MGKTSQKQKEKRLAGRVSLALAAGMFSVVPVAHGMPTVDQIKTDGTNVGSPSAADANGYRHMNITGVDKNVIHWKDFSIAEKEHVHFDNHDYMNVVTGKATSAINGIMDGGNNVYLINPNGVIFGSTAQVNVGNLYVSTRKGDIDALETEFLEDGSTVNTVLPKLTTAPTADVVSLIDEKGYVAATSVVMEGNNIRFLNSSSVVTSVTDNGDGTFSNPVAHTDAATLVLRSNASSYIHVGDANTDAGTNYKYTAAHVDGSAATSVNYKIVRTKDDLAGMSLNDSNANYMLANNIDLASIANFTPVGNGTTSGNPFKGHFDGMFYTINNLKQSGGSSSNYLGLFGHTKDARIENVGLENARVDGQYAGGIVGYAANTTILNVWNAGWTDANHNYVEEKNNNSVSIGKAASFNTYVGGLVGFSKSSTLASSYNASYVNGSGLVGKMDQNTSSTVYDSYNVGKLGISGGKVYGICMANYNNDYVYNVYSASNYSHKNYLGTGSAEQLTGKGADNNSFVIDSSTAYRTGNPFSIASESGNPFSYLLYKDTAHWSISSDGASDTTWRIYEGYSLPLLNSFMKAKGTVSTEYTYGDTNVTSSNYNKKAVPNKVYDAKTVMGDTPVYSYLGANVTADTNLINVNNRQNVYTDTSGDAAKFALFSGGQQGYDLYGNNFKIEQRNISYNGGGTKNFSKEYDGTKDGTNVLKALFSASSTSSDQGFLDADAANVKFVLGSSVSATYNDEDVLEANSFTISGTGASGAIKLEAAQGAKNPDAYKNYKVGTVTNLDGTYTNGQNATVQITPRSIKVSLKETGGITKTYDGTATVTDQNKGTTGGFFAQ